MFGQMTMSPVVQLSPNSHLEAAIAALLQAAEQPEIVRWIEFPKSVLLFVMCQAIRNRAQFMCSIGRAGPGTPLTSMTKNTVAITSSNSRHFSKNTVSLAWSSARAYCEAVRRGR